MAGRRQGLRRGLVLTSILDHGVGRLSLFEGQTLDATNVTRVYGSRLTDVGRPKVQIIERLAKEIGFGTEVTLFPKHITSLETAKTLRDCDVIFGFTDDEWGRSILSKLAIDYYIPVFDMGVKIDSMRVRLSRCRAASPLFSRGGMPLLPRQDHCRRRPGSGHRELQPGASRRTPPPAVCARVRGQCARRHRLYLCCSFHCGLGTSAPADRLHGTGASQQRSHSLFRPEQNANQSPCAEFRLLLWRPATLGTGRPAAVPGDGMARIRISNVLRRLWASRRAALRAAPSSTDPFNAENSQT